jgi:MFS family permease
VLAITTVVSFLTAFSSSAVNIALPAIGNEFAMDAVLLGWVNTAFLLVSAVFLIPMGKLGDITGRKKIFLTGIAVFIGASAVSLLSADSAVFLLSRALQGIGGAMIFGTSGAIVVSVFPPEIRGRAIGLNTASVYVGLSAGPFLGGILTHAFGWRSIFWMSAAIAVIVIPAILVFMRTEWAEAKGEKLDWRGSLLYAAALSVLILGFSKLPNIAGIALVAAGILGIAAFCLVEWKVKHPVLNIRLFAGNRTFAFSNLAAMINYSATFSVVFFLSFYLQAVKGMTARGAGAVLVVQPFIQAVLSPLAGRFSEKIEPRILSSSGMALCAAGLLLLTFLDGNSGIAYIILALVLLGTGFALFSSPNTNAVMSSVDKKHYGIATATLGTMRLLGQMLSMAAALLLFALFIGHVQVNQTTAEPFLKAMRTGFGIFSALCAAGIYISLSRGRMHQR